jgi:hypothetical protein
MVRAAAALSLMLLCAVALPPHAHAQATPAAEALPRWMSGCWSGERGGERFTERWTAVDADTLLAVTYIVARGKMGMFEFLRIVRRQGRLVFVAQPTGRPPTEFAATSVSDRRVVFENAANDFPKRVTYLLNDTSQLVGIIDKGTDAGRIEYPMSRVSCEP